jgi:hypothetical protein
VDAYRLRLRLRERVFGVVPCQIVPWVAGVERQVQLIAEPLEVLAVAAHGAKRCSRKFIRLPPFALTHAWPESPMKTEKTASAGSKLRMTGALHRIRR